MKVQVLQSFAGVDHSYGKGAIIDLPENMAVSYARLEMVRILEQPKEEIAYSTMEAATPEMAVKKSPPRKTTKK